MTQHRDILTTDLPLARAGPRLQQTRLMALLIPERASIFMFWPARRYPSSAGCFMPALWRSGLWARHVYGWSRIYFFILACITFHLSMCETFVSWFTGSRVHLFVDFFFFCAPHSTYPRDTTRTTTTVRHCFLLLSYN